MSQIRHIVNLRNWENYVSNDYFENKCKGGTKNLFFTIQVTTKNNNNNKIYIYIK